MLHCAMMAILAIRSNCFKQFRIWCCLKSFKIATMAAILDIRTNRCSNSEFLCHPRCLPSSFASTWITVWEEMWFEEFQAGGHWNRWTLAILNFHNTPMPPIMFKLNQTYRLVADVIWRFSRWLPWWPPSISERNYCNNSKSPWCPDAFHRFHSIRLTVREQIATEDFQGGRRWCCLKIFKMADMADILDIGTE